MAKPGKVRISEGALRKFVGGIFSALGMTAEGAATVADVLVWANLRGVDSHGVTRVPRYAELFESGDAKARANVRVERTRASTILVEADGAPGPVALRTAMAEAIHAARETGVAWAAVRGTVHTGAIGYYTSMAAEQGMIGIGLVAGVPNMAYYGARGAGVATSPLSIAVPGGERAGALLDMATAVIALGKIAQYKIKGQPLPEGMALTGDGLPTTDPAAAKIPLPMAGAKGAGMSLMFELLTSVLVGNAIVSEFHGGKPEGKRHRQNAALIALDVAAFGSLDAFKSQTDATLDTIKRLPPVNAEEPVLYPGERGARTFVQRQSNGIPLPGATWQSLVEDATRLGVSVPEVTQE
jgi:LDH2 family malate/lactate/ureidoglycolate dehydrogenase